MLLIVFFKLIHAVAIEDSLVNGDQGFIQFENIDSCIDTMYYAQNVISFPNTIIIDYGNSNNVCSDGYVKNGRINAIISAPYYSTGSTTKISFTNFSIDSLQISGTMTILNNGSTFNVVVNDATLDDGDTTHIIWNYDAKLYLD